MPRGFMKWKLLCTCWFSVIFSPSSTSPNFRQIEVKYCSPNNKDQYVLCTYLGWHTKKGSKWTIDLAYKSVWINTDTILCAWKPRNGSKSETMTIPKRHIDFANDNLARLAARKWYREMKWNWGWRWRMILS